MEKTITMSLSEYNKMCELKRTIDYKVKKGEVKYFRVVRSDSNTFEDVYIDSENNMIQIAVNQNEKLSKRYDELERKYDLLKQEYGDLVYKIYVLEKQKESKKLFGWL